MGLAANFSVEFSLSTLGPVGGFGSNIFGGIFAKYFGASCWVWQEHVRWNLWLSALGPVGGFGSEIVGGISAKYFGDTGGVLSAKFSVAIFAKYFGTSGGGSEIFGGIFTKYFGADGWSDSEFFSGIFAKYIGASGWVWQRNCRWIFC